MDIMKAVEATMKKAGVSSSGSDAKFFTTNRKGENHELREELRSPQRDKKRDAVKKVIANMTVGKDVSTLFTDVLNCIQTGKLSYSTIRFHPTVLQITSSSKSLCTFI